MHRSVPAKLLDREKMVGRRVAANRGARTVVAKKVASLTVVGSLVAKEKMAKDHLDSKVKDKDPLKAAGPVEDHTFRINARRTVETRASQKVVFDHYVGYKRFQRRRFQWKVIYSMCFEERGRNMLRTFLKL